MLKELLEEKKLSIYQCAKLSSIPYTTLSEIVRGKTKIEKCSAETVYRLSKILNISMEELLLESMESQVDFEVFKSNVCHSVKATDEFDFIVETLQKDSIRSYWRMKRYAEAFYLLGMVDYLSRINEIPLCTKYDDIRGQSLEKPIYPKDVDLAAKLENNPEIYEQCRKDAIPEFLRFNIVESEINDVY